MLYVHYIRLKRYSVYYEIRYTNVFFAIFHIKVISYKMVYNLFICIMMQNLRIFFKDIWTQSANISYFLVAVLYRKYLCNFSHGRNDSSCSNCCKTRFGNLRIWQPNRQSYGSEWQLYGELFLKSKLRCLTSPWDLTYVGWPDYSTPTHPMTSN